MKRLIRSGETFTEDELAADAELQSVPPVTNPDDYIRNEPWAVDNGDA
jgi:hypothetical protein